MTPVESMLLVLAAAMPFDKIVEELQNAIEEYKVNPSAANKEKVTFHAILIMTKNRVDQDKGDILKTMKDFETTKENMEIGSRITGKNSKTS
jgi:hypothetical protein